MEEDVDGRRVVSIASKLSAAPASNDPSASLCSVRFVLSSLHWRVRGVAAVHTTCTAAAGTTVVGVTMKRTGASAARLIDIAEWLTKARDEKTRRRLVLEFLEGWQWEPAAARHYLVVDEPPLTGDQRYDVLLAGLAEWLTAQDGQPAPWWADGRALTTWWFPSDTAAGRADAIVHAPAALRRRGVFIAAIDLERA